MFEYGIALLVGIGIGIWFGAEFWPKIKDRL